MTYAKITLIGNLGADPELAFDNQNRRSEEHTSELQSH